MKKFFDLYAKYLSIFLVLLCSILLVTITTKPVIDGVYTAGGTSIRFTNGLCIIEDEGTPTACVYHEQDGTIHISGVSQSYSQSFPRSSVYRFGNFFSIKAFVVWILSIMLFALSIFYSIYCWGRYIMFKDEIRKKWEVLEQKNN